MPNQKPDELRVPQGGCPAGFGAVVPQATSTDSNDAANLPVSYGSYLNLESILSAQHPKSTGTLQNKDPSSGSDHAHDEMLFIIVHQAHELWFKQILFELDSVLQICRRTHIEESTIGTATARLERIVSILALLNDHLRVLETMTPMDFLEFRNFLNPASGFQSVQFRLLETKLGLPKKRLEYLGSSIFANAVNQRERELLNQAMEEPSLFELVETWLERTPFLETTEFNFWQAYQTAIEKHIDADFGIVRNQPALSEDQKNKRFIEIDRTRQAYMDLFDSAKHARHVQDGIKRLSLKATHAALFIYLYRDQPILQTPFRFLTQMTKIDELLQTWRATHTQMVHRMIGIKSGTGGSSGYEYLKSTIHSRAIFSDFCELSTFLLPRSSLPALPKGYIRKLGFWNEYAAESC